MTVATNRYLISTRATLALCTSCGMPVLAAHAEGIPTTVDVTPLTRRGELLTVTEGRACFALRAGELVHRDMHRLITPANVVVAEHRCHDPVDSARHESWPAVQRTDEVPVIEGAPPW